MTIQNIIDFARSLWVDPYLILFWRCLFGYTACYLLALVIAQGTRRRGGSTLVFKARQAWAIALAIHLVAIIMVTTLWSIENLKGLKFQNWERYLTAYVVLSIIDFLVIVKMISGLKEYRSYSRQS